MASVKKSYFLAPSWDIKPEEVALGNVIADFMSPQRTLSASELSSHIDSRIIHTQDRTSSGSIETERKGMVGIFATFLQVIKTGNLSFSHSHSMNIRYKCASIETQRFIPSPTFIDQAANDKAVSNYLKRQGLGAKVFIITGIKTATQIELTTTETSQRDVEAQLGVDVIAASATAGPKISYNPRGTSNHTTTIQGPIVFAIQVDKLQLRWRKNGVVTTEGYTAGALLDNRKSGEKYIVEQVAETLEEDEIGKIGAHVCQGIDDETGKECEVVFIGDS